MSDARGVQSSGVTAKATSASLWIFARIIFEQIFSFFVFVVVARILGPADVGLFALGLIIAEFARTWAMSGFSDAATRASVEDEEEIARAAFWGNLVVGFVMATLLSLLAGPIATLIDMPSLKKILIAVSWTIPISCASAIHMVRQLRRFGHKSQAIRALISGFIGGGIAIAAVLNGYGVWTFVVQRYVTEAITLITAWQAYPWLPRFPTRWKTLAGILPYSLHMSASRLMMLFLTRVEDLAIGGIASERSLGIFRVARRTNDMLIKFSLTPLSSVSSNFFVVVRDDSERMRRSFLTLMKLSCLITFPLFFGLAVTADIVIPMIYGIKWIEAVPILKIMSPICIPLVIGLYTVPLLGVLGKGQEALKTSAAQLVLSVIIVLFARPYGLDAIIIGFVLRAYIFIPYHVYVIRRCIGCNSWAVYRTLLGPLMSSFIMAIFSRISIDNSSISNVEPILRLIIAVCVGAISYVGSLYFFDRKALISVQGLIMNLVNKRR